jgi:hypothetical protein
MFEFANGKGDRCRAFEPKISRHGIAKFAELARIEEKGFFRVPGGINTALVFFVTMPIPFPSLSLPF